MSSVMMEHQTNSEWGEHRRQSNALPRAQPSGGVPSELRNEKIDFFPHDYHDAILQIHIPGAKCMRQQITTLRK